MRFAIDENESPKLLEYWKFLFPGEEFHHVIDLELTATPDVELLSKLPELGFDAFITRDRNQLRNPDELDALKRSGISWISHKESPARGAQGFREVAAAYAVALPHIINLINERQEPIVFQIRRMAGSPQQLFSAHQISTGAKIQLPR